MPELPAPPATWYSHNRYGRLHLFSNYPSIRNVPQPPPFQEPYTRPHEQLPPQRIECPIPAKPILSDNGTNGAGIVGVATYYSQASSSKKTATGEYFDESQLTAASPLVPGTRKAVYPLGSRMKVTLLSNYYGKPVDNAGNSIVVRINDTGGFAKFPDHRVIDLSPGAMKALTGRLTSVRVKLEYI